jgi:ribosomal protein S18 acetylase RimI-like enzyme
MPSDIDRAEWLRRYDAELRTALPSPPPKNVRVEPDGPLLRVFGLGRGGMILYEHLAGLCGEALDALIARQRAVFEARGEPVEWKLHGHDHPVDLPVRLQAAGFVPEPRETVMVGAVAPLAAAAVRVPDGLRLREVAARADLDRIAALKALVWNEPSDWLAESLEREHAADSRAIAIVVAEAQAAHGAEWRVISAGWIRFGADGTFGTIWGGATDPAFRRRGIYEALVTYRAQVAAHRGRGLLQVDASDDSRPILERLGFAALTTTTPFVFDPRARA